ncbi:MAG: hypothetical protein JKY54_14540 [Flavobacteriales bacterium]|nr:hypothetical protein [Flavobacteriales bacterium]
MKALRLTILTSFLLIGTSSIAGSELGFEISNPSELACKWTVNILAPSSGSTYSVDAGKSFQSSPVFENLCEGRYFVHVKDASGNLLVSKFEINAPQNEIENPSNISNDQLKLDLISQYHSTTDQATKINLQWQLFRLDVRYEVELEKLVEPSQTIYSFTLLHPAGASISSYSIEKDRLLSMFGPHLLDMTVDNKFNATVKFKSETSEQDLLTFLHFIGFDNYKITNL